LTRGKLISFEGIDGSGKSTQAKRAYNHLRNKGIECRLLREPGDTVLGERIRSILLSAARAELSRTVINPLLERSCAVLLDRFGDSSTAYQGYGHDVDLDFILRTNEIATGGIKPDLTILFDVDPETALSRPGNFDDRIEKRGLDFFQRVRNGFLTLAEKESDRFRIVDASQDIETVAGEVIRHIDELFC